MTHKSHTKSDLAKLVSEFRVPSSTTDDAIYSFFSSLDSPLSLSCWLLYKNKEYQQLLDKELDPLKYCESTRFRDDYAAVSFLSKAEFLSLDVSKEDAAFAKFFKYEELCKSTNARFMNLSSDPLYTGENVWLLHSTINKIDSVLGGFSADEFVDGANWGPGVTTLLKGSHVSAVNKFHSENGITRDLYSFIGPWFPEAYPAWWKVMRDNFGASPFCMQVGNKIVTVPKNSKTDRVIAVEPGVNLYLQKSIGNMIKKRLLRKGVNINLREQGVNQKLALIGSLDGSLATVDFSSASDSISREVVRTLISDQRWLSLMECTRSSFGAHKNDLIKWEKFSSMGNGFTFELESLIFWAAASAVKERLAVQGPISVYGDDVILPTECYDLFASFTEFLGFRVNPKKSFSSSGFRESCGAHYFEGNDVKPIFLKERLQSVQAIYKLANSVRNLAHRRNSSSGCDARFHRCWRRLFSRVPESVRFKVSAGYGEVGFAVNLDEASPPLAASRSSRQFVTDGFEGYLVKAALETGVTQYFDQEALLLARLKVPSFEECGNNYTLRDRTRVRVKNILVPQWYNFGPWF